MVRDNCFHGNSLSKVACFSIVLTGERDKQKCFCVAKEWFYVALTDLGLRVTHQNQTSRQMTLLFKAASIILIATQLTGCMFRTKDDMKTRELSNQELVKRGEYLVNTSACHDCHSPKLVGSHGLVLDPDRILSGHPQDQKLPVIPSNSENWILFNQGLTGFVGPWGVSYSANLTPDATGTGTWTFDQFKIAIRKGKYKGMEAGRDLLPPMPWEMYKNFTDADLLAIFSYLQSIKPVRNIVPAPITPDQLKSLTNSTNPL
jgi:hypothetical protein